MIINMAFRDDLSALNVKSIATIIDYKSIPNLT